MYGRNSVLSLATPSGEGLNGADVKPSGRTIVHWDLLLTMQAQDGTLVIQEALEKVEGAAAFQFTLSSPCRLLSGRS